MRKQTVLKVIEKELEQLDVPKSSDAYRLTKEQAIEAADIMNQAQLKQYINDYIENLPSALFQQ